MLQDKPQEVLIDLARNTNAVQPFAFQLPYARQLRDECNRCAASIEAAAATSSGLQQELESMIVQINERKIRTTELEQQVAERQEVIRIAQSLGSKEKVIESLDRGRRM